MTKRLAFGAAPFLVGVLLAATASTALSDVKANEFLPAQAGEKTYELGHFEIEYPYGVSVEGGTTAAVGYVAEWATGLYPGVADCRLTLFDSSSAVVGEAQFTLDSGSAVFHRPVGREVEVKGQPTSGEGGCSVGNSDQASADGNWTATATSPAFDRSGPDQPRRYEDRLMIEFDVDWANDTTFQKTCRITISYKDGTERTLEPFNTNMGSGHQEYNVLVGDPDTVETANLRCSDLGS